MIIQKYLDREVKCCEREGKTQLAVLSVQTPLLIVQTAVLSVQTPVLSELCIAMFQIIDAHNRGFTPLISHLRFYPSPFTMGEKTHIFYLKIAVKGQCSPFTTLHRPSRLW